MVTDHYYLESVKTKSGTTKEDKVSPRSIYCIWHKMSVPARKIPQWKLDMLADADVAAQLVIKKADADKVAAEKAARDAESASACLSWHAARPEWVTQMVETAPGIRGNEREWEVPPQVGLRKMKNNAKCPYCGK